MARHDLSIADWIFIEALIGYNYIGGVRSVTTWSNYALNWTEALPAATDHYRCAVWCNDDALCNGFVFESVIKRCHLLVDDW